MFDGSWDLADWFGFVVGLAVLVFWVLPGVYLAAHEVFVRGGHGGDEGHGG